MTRFEREYEWAKIDWGYAMEIVERRRNELKRIDAEGRHEKNAFRMAILAKEYMAKKHELELFEDLLDWM